MAYALNNKSIDLLKVSSTFLNCHEETEWEATKISTPTNAMGDTQVGTNGHAGTPYEDGRSSTLFRLSYYFLCWLQGIDGSTRLTIEKSRQEERNTDGTLLYDWDGENDPRNP